MQMDRCKQTIVIGCMVFLAMKHRAHVIGPAGMALQPNNFALVACSTMKMLIHAIGPRMWRDVKNIVSTNFPWLSTHTFCLFVLHLHR